MMIRTGSLYVPFEENAKIARANFLAGRPFDEGWLASRHIPDPRFPEWVEIVEID